MSQPRRLTRGGVRLGFDFENCATSEWTQIIGPIQSQGSRSKESLPLFRLGLRFCVMKATQLQFAITGTA